MRHFLIFLITLYQKYISPHKGFNCAYACYHQDLSCSAMVKTMIAEHGLIAGWPMIQQQFLNCHLAYEALQQQDEEELRRRRRRRRRNQDKECFLTKDKCDCASNVGDCLPDLSCDCSLSAVRLKRESIHKNHS